jgi:hypothetical protein
MLTEDFAKILLVARRFGRTTGNEHDHGQEQTARWPQQSSHWNHRKTHLHRLTGSCGSTAIECHSYGSTKTFPVTTR